MQLFYNPALDNSTMQVVFDAVASNHIIKVLRKKQGDTLQITNGKGHLFEAEILEAHPKKCKVQVVSTKKKHQKRYWFHIAVAPTKSNDRFEWFLEKATEIGVNEITPLICEHSERKVVKQERMQKVVEAAMKQSLQTYLPKVNDPISYKEFMNQDHEGLLFIAHCQDGEKIDLKRRVAPDTDITLLIGPEGDFSKNEIDAAGNAGFIPVSLGDNRLRTETAAIVACTVINMINSR